MVLGPEERKKREVEGGIEFIIKALCVLTCSWCKRLWGRNSLHTWARRASAVRETGWNPLFKAVILPNSIQQTSPSVTGAGLSSSCGVKNDLPHFLWVNQHLLPSPARGRHFLIPLSLCRLTFHPDPTSPPSKLRFALFHHFPFVLLVRRSL